MIIGLCGYAQSGKDTAAQLLALYGYERRAFADALREVVYRIDPIIPNSDDYEDGTTTLQELVDRHGWDFAKVNYPEIRRLLQVTGTEAVRQVLGDSIWVDHVMDGLANGEDIVITDVRFPNEIEAVREAGGVLVWVRREGVGPINGHASDNAISAEDCDWVLDNPGTMEDYGIEVSELLWEIDHFVDDLVNV